MAPRQSDRWVTPAVIVTALMVGGIVVLALIGAMTFLVDRGLNPDPMVKLVGSIVAALSSLGTLALQLVHRAGLAKVERNTGALATQALDRLEATDRLGRHVTRPPVPANRAAPAPPGS